MLVLSRKVMEKLYIGDDIAVTVTRINGGIVRLGIDAPEHVPIMRSELVGGTKPLPTAPRDRFGRREDVNVESMYDDGQLGGGAMG